MYVSSSHACKDGGVYLDDFLNAAYKHGLAVFLLVDGGGGIQEGQLKMCYRREVMEIACR